MKGFVFTLDAVFALVVAAVGVSVLLYMNSVTVSNYNGATSQAYAILQSALSTTIASASSGPYVNYLNESAQHSTFSWGQLGHDGLLSSSSGYSVDAPLLLYTFSTANVMMPFAATDSGFTALVSGNRIYIINSTTGNQVGAIPSGNPANVVGAPAIYMNMLYYANASGAVKGVNLYNLSQKWAFTASNSVTTPMEIENRYLAFGTSNGIYLLNPLNGNYVAFAPTGSPVGGILYLDGEYVASVSAAQGSLYSYSRSGNSLTNTWNALLAGSSVTLPSSTNSTIAVGSGDYFYIFTAGGTKIYQSGDLSSRVLGISSYGNSYYVQTVKGMYGFTSMGNTIFSVNTVSDSQNSVPTASDGGIYTLINGNAIQGYSGSGKKIFNITLTSNYLYSGYSNIALAYGKMYVASGNTLYVFGAYGAKPNDSILQAVSSMYLNGKGGYSDIVMQKLYNSTNAGIFINNTFAPDLSVATFNSAAQSYIRQTNGFQWMDSAANSFSISVWVNPASNNGVIVDELGQQYLGGSWHKSMLELVSGKLYARVYNLQCMYLGAIPIGEWSNIVLTYNGYENGYVNGMQSNSIKGSRSVPGGGALMYYPLGSGDSVNCGSGSYFTGKMLNYQIYNNSISRVQVSRLYQEGAFGSPVNSSSDVLWMPLLGSTNDFSGSFNFGVQQGVQYGNTVYMPASFYNAYEVSRASVAMPVKVNGTYRNYNVSVVEWR